MPAERSIRHETRAHSSRSPGVPRARSRDPSRIDYLHADRRVCRPTADNSTLEPDVLVTQARRGGLGRSTRSPSCRRAGCRATPVTTRVQRGHLHRVHRGVFAVGHPRAGGGGPVPRRGQGVWSGRRAESHVGGGVVGIVAWDNDHPEVTVCGGGTRTRPGLRVHRTIGWAGPARSPSPRASQ